MARKSPKPSFIEKGLVKNTTDGIKILSKGTLTKKLVVKATPSAPRPRKPSPIWVEALRSLSNEKVRLDLQKQRNRQPYFLYGHGSFRPEDRGGHHVPGVKVDQAKMNELISTPDLLLALMDLLGGGASKLLLRLRARRLALYHGANHHPASFKDVLPALTELSKQGEYGRKKTEMATRYLTLLLGAVQAYGIIKTMQNSSYISLTMGDNFWTYAYIVTVLLGGRSSRCGSATRSPRKA
jgi:hypothetical protein